MIAIQTHECAQQAVSEGEFYVIFLLIHCGCSSFAGAGVPGFATTGFAAERDRWSVGLGSDSLNLGLRLGWGAATTQRTGRVADEGWDA